jgi:hypothetical protein
MALLVLLDRLVLLVLLALRVRVVTVNALTVLMNVIVKVMAEVVISI